MNVIIGFDKHTDHLVDQLLDSKIKQKSVLSIVGMGGLGKTTLAKKVYNTLENNTRFSTLVWTTVSETFIPIELVKDIAGKAMGTSKDDLARMRQDEVETKLYSFLKDRVYLIVLDDVWKPDVWETVTALFPDVMNGSRVMLTTRNEDVAKLAVPNFTPFMLPLLTDDQSWELFTRRIFPASPFPEELIEPGRRMANKCAGLPLALLVIGGYLLTKETTPTAWMRVDESMDWGTTTGVERCMQILALSYVNLPHPLKSCFLYVATFPEDAEIDFSKLAELWIAEGFIPESGRGTTMEDTARSYFDDLVQRSLLQHFVVRNAFWEDYSKCRIHDLLRQMCLKEAEHDGFLSVRISGEVTATNSSNGSVTILEPSISSSRRMSFHNFGIPNDISLPRNLRSLFLRHNQHYYPEFSFLKRLKLLRVLELYCVGLDRRPKMFPEEIKFLSNLRYLKLNGDFSTVPSFIGKLQNLQTLHLEHDIKFNIGLIFQTNFCLELPKELGKLPNLRHFYLFTASDTYYCPPFNSSTKLQTLKCIKCDQSWMEENLPRLTNLRNLGIQASGDEMVSFDSLAKLNRLAALSFFSFEVPTEFINIILVLSNHNHLQILDLKGEWKTRRGLPESNRFPQNLVYLDLSSCRLESDPMPVLENLPHLATLMLSKAYDGEEMACTTNGFPQLQYLYLGSFMNLRDWTVEVGAFPKLSELHIDNCQKLVMLPEGLQHVTSLKKLLVVDAPQEFKKRLEKDVGEDWHKIKHVPTIEIIEIIR